MSQESQNRLNEKLIVLAKFDTAADAHCLRLSLENHGIRASISNELSAQTIGTSLFGRIAGISIEVFVLEGDLERALEIKQNYLNSLKGTPIPEWTCECGATVDAGFAKCWACNREYEE